MHQVKQEFRLYGGPGDGEVAFVAPQIHYYQYAERPDIEELSLCLGTPNDYILNDDGSVSVNKNKIYNNSMTSTYNIHIYKMQHWCFESRGRSFEVRFLAWEKLTPESVKGIAERLLSLQM